MKTHREQEPHPVMRRTNLPGKRSRLPGHFTLLLCGALRRLQKLPSFLFAVLAFPCTAIAENAVIVTVEAADTSLIVGESTTVTVFGQIDAAIEAGADRIFTWYIDVLNSGGGVAAGYASFQTPTSDNAPPPASGDGTGEGSNRRGIFDSFLGTPAAGKGSRIVLAQFEVTALAPGTATFSAAPGTTRPIAFDFQVAMTGGGSSTGGNYSAASVDIVVFPPPGDVDLKVRLTGSHEVELSFTPQAGFNHRVQRNADLTPDSWADLPGGPHDLGTVLIDTIGAPVRFYRIVLTAQ